MTPAARPEEPRRCIKCGREVGPDVSICEVCNRAGMVPPSATQYHGTVVVAIILAVVGLAAAASLSLRGVGPYAAEVQVIEPGDRVGWAITFEVTNEGTRPGRAKCRVVALDAAGRQLGTDSTVTGQVPGGGRARVTAVLFGVEDEPATATVSCS